MDLGSLLQIVREPVLAETRANLQRSWQRLDPRYRTPHQMLGRQGNGCGATIGAMPRCDFACRGCYLGEEANRIPAASLEDLKRQIDHLRPLLGNAGNLQLTDGEITLRPDDEVIELIRYAIQVGLIPMLMTHGDSFRRRPGLMERYVREGGLREISIHVDTTQRGRKGARWRQAATEAELNPLREEFADMVRAARRATGAPIRCATTMTVTRENVTGVADVMRWLTRHADVFRLISFQPIAQVGRTEDGLGGGVSVDELWAEVARGLDTSVGTLERSYQWLGHPGCNRFVHGFVARSDRAASTSYLPVRVDGDGVGPDVVDGFLRRFGGVTFRRDSGVEAFVRIVSLFARAPGFALRHLWPFARYWLQRLDAGHPWRALRALFAGRLRTESLVVVSHHFMSPQQLETALGRERVAHCVFHVSIDGEHVSMCEANAQGRREQYYATLRRRGAGEAEPAATVAAD
jgi:hypothetical protein